MRESRTIMSMPVIVEIADEKATVESLEKIFSYFTKVDQQFSTYKQESEISQINRKEIPEEAYSPDMQEVFALAEKTKQETNGYFDIQTQGGTLDPSGIVKGWAIQRAAQLILDMGFKNCYVDIGGDIQTYGKNSEGGDWSIGIRNPFQYEEIVKVIYPRGKGVATSGTAARGQHIYNPHSPEMPLKEVVSVTVIGPNVCEADRFATAAFAMGRAGVSFIEQLEGFEGYAIDHSGIATMTSHFSDYTA